MSYLTEVLADSPAHYWRFADPGGQRAADIGSGVRTSHIPVAGFSPAAYMPYTGFASDGGSLASGIRWISGMPVQSCSAWTIEACVYCVATGATLSGIFEVGYATNTYAGFTVFPGGAPHWYYGAGPTDVFGTHFLTPETWHHLVLTNDGTNLRGYMDAILEVTQAGPAVTQIGAGTSVHGVHTATNTSPGAWISELAVYTSALSPTRITAHYAALPSSSGPVWKAASSSDTSSLAADLSAIHSAVIRSVIIPGQP